MENYTTNVFKGKSDTKYSSFFDVKIFVIVVIVTTFGVCD